jgi:hypothetical protein
VPGREVMNPRAVPRAAVAHGLHEGVAFRAAKRLGQVFLDGAAPRAEVVSKDHCPAPRILST